MQRFDDVTSEEFVSLLRQSQGINLGYISDSLNVRSSNYGYRNAKRWIDFLERAHDEAPTWDIELENSLCWPFKSNFEGCVSYENGDEYGISNDELDISQHGLEPLGDSAVVNERILEPGKAIVSGRRRGTYDSSPLTQET